MKVKTSMGIRVVILVLIFLYSAKPIQGDNWMDDGLEFKNYTHDSLWKNPEADENNVKISIHVAFYEKIIITSISDDDLKIEISKILQIRSDQSKEFSPLSEPTIGVEFYSNDELLDTIKRTQEESLLQFHITIHVSKQTGIINFVENYLGANQFGACAYFNLTEEQEELGFRSSFCLHYDLPSVSETNNIFLVNSKSWELGTKINYIFDSNISQENSYVVTKEEERGEINQWVLEYEQKPPGIEIAQIYIGKETGIITEKIREENNDEGEWQYWQIVSEELHTLLEDDKIPINMGFAILGIFTVFVIVNWKKSRRQY